MNNSWALWNDNGSWYLLNWSKVEINKFPTTGENYVSVEYTYVPEINGYHLNLLRRLIVVKTAL